jgi:transposase
MAQKTFTAEFKAKVAIAALKGNQTINELTTEFGVHSTQISNWKKQLLDCCKNIFSEKNVKAIDVITQERDRLYTQVGRLAVELDWLKKKTGHLN